MGFKRFVRRAVKRPSRKALRRIRYAYTRVRWGVDRPILVFQMGRVGSTAVRRALRWSGLGVRHLHLLNDLDRMEAWARTFDPEPPALLKQVELGREVRREMELDPEHRWNVITLVRDPIARNISAFFLSLDDTMPRLRDEIEEREDPYPVLLEAFLNEFDHSAPLDWFDLQMKPVFGIDVFDSPFPHERGFQILDGDRIHLLIVRTGDLARCFREAFRDFLRVRAGEPREQNVAARKWYAGPYRDFVKRFRAPDEYLSRMYDSKFSRHFFTNEEIARMRSRWSPSELPGVRPGPGSGGP